MKIKFYNEKTEGEFLALFFFCADCKNITRNGDKFHKNINVDNEAICPDCWEKYDYCHGCNRLYLRKEVFFTASCPECEKK